MADSKSRKGFANTPTMITAKRAMGITKTYIAMTALFIILAVVAWNPANYVPPSWRNSTNATTSNALVSNTANNSTATGIMNGSFSGLPLLSVPLYVMPALMLITPIMMLFVYDKNNGLLEYMLSLGMTQREIYMQYIKAALLLTLALFVVFIPAYIVYSRTVYGVSLTNKVLPTLFLVVPLALAVVSFMSVCMIAFSSLQKARAGSNQPLGLIIGWAGTAPAYLVPFVVPFNVGIYLDLGIAAAIAIAAFALLMSSDRLIRNEKLLP